ncbi:Hypothetical predicted protein [Pelobates cultripes]|uniref:Uncharacterized protein n=1 Tax=Pelobates cultripes TaxID=61616 RepID=A0AAD1VLG9_PELCU|nr:Hypothetical predicted protein [Pelobates cultripes]
MRPVSFYVLPSPPISLSSSYIPALLQFDAKINDTVKDNSLYTEHVEGCGESEEENGRAHKRPSTPETDSSVSSDISLNDSGNGPQHPLAVEQIDLTVDDDQLAMTEDQIFCEYCFKATEPFPTAEQLASHPMHKQCPKEPLTCLQDHLADSCCLYSIHNPVTVGRFCVWN